LRRVSCWKHAEGSTPHFVRLLCNPANFDCGEVFYFILHSRRPPSDNK